MIINYSVGEGAENSGSFNLEFIQGQLKKNALGR